MFKSDLKGDINLNLKYNKSYLSVGENYGEDYIQQNLLFSGLN